MPLRIATFPAWYDQGKCFAREHVVYARGRDPDIVKYWSVLAVSTWMAESEMNQNDALLDAVNSKHEHDRTSPAPISIPEVRSADTKDWMRQVLGETTLSDWILHLDGNFVYKRTDEVWDRARKVAAQSEELLGVLEQTKESILTTAAAAFKDADGLEDLFTRFRILEARFDICRTSESFKLPFVLPGDFDFLSQLRKIESSILGPALAIKALEVQRVAELQDLQRDTETGRQIEEHWNSLVGEAVACKAAGLLKPIRDLRTVSTRLKDCFTASALSCGLQEPVDFNEDLSRLDRSEEKDGYLPSFIECKLYTRKLLGAGKREEALEYAAKVISTIQLCTPKQFTKPQQTGGDHERSTSPRVTKFSTGAAKKKKSIKNLRTFFPKSLHGQQMSNRVVQPLEDSTPRPTTGYLGPQKLAPQDPHTKMEPQEVKSALPAAYIRKSKSNVSLGWMPLRRRPVDTSQSSFDHE